MRRRIRDANDGNGDRWLVSYADFVTLLFAFFTAMYAISVTDSAKAHRLAASLRASFGETLFEDGSEAPRVLSQPGGRRPELGQRNRVRQDTVAERQRFDLLEKRTSELARAVHENADVDEPGVSVRRSEEGLVISLAETAFFGSGGAQLSAQSRKLVEELAGILETVPNHLRVEGHSDSQAPEAGSPSNWQLSAARAVAVVDVLATSGVAAYRLSASGFADQRPLVSNTSPEGRRMNRRVEVVVLRARAPE